MILGQAFARFVLDLDGVVWTGDKALPGAPETVRGLREVGKRICFLTNNSSQAPDSYAKRLTDIGAGADVREVVTSADATARLLERTVPGLRGRATYVIGGEGLTEAVASTGARLVDGDEGSEATLVVVGWDTRLTYRKLRLATLAIRRGATFVASNTDATLPSHEGLIPGAGATVAALRTATGMDPMVAGKPEPGILEIARARLGGSPALVVGDRVETDVLAAKGAGWPAALVLSGATGVPELAVAPVWPDFLLRKLSDLLEDLPHPRVRPATGPDLPAIATLLHDAGLHVGAARERLGRTIVADCDRKVVGTAAWDPAGEDAIVRSVAVATGSRRRAVGVGVVAAAARAAAAAGHRTLYVVTRESAAFFERWGFKTVAREDLPEAVAEHPQLSRECPSSAPVLRLAL